MTDEQKKQIVIDYLYDLGTFYNSDRDPFNVNGLLKSFDDMTLDEKVDFIQKEEKQC